MLPISYIAALSSFLPSLFLALCFYGNWQRALQVTWVVAESKASDHVNVSDAFKFIEHTGVKGLLVWPKSNCVFKRYKIMTMMKTNFTSEKNVILFYCILIQ